SSGLFDVVAELPPEGEGLVVVLQGGVGLAHLVVDPAEVVEGEGLAGLVAVLAVEGQELLETGARRGQSTDGEIQQANDVAGLLLRERLALAPPESDGLLRGAASGGHVPGSLENESERAQDGCHTAGLVERPPERQGLPEISDRGPQVGRLEFQLGDVERGLGLPAPVAHGLPRRQSLAVRGQRLAPRRGAGRELAGAAHRLQGRRTFLVLLGGGRQRLRLDRVAPRRTELLFGADLDALDAVTARDPGGQQQDLRSPAFVGGADGERLPPRVTLRRDDEVDALLLDKDEDGVLSHLDAVGVFLPARDPELARRAGEERFRFAGLLRPAWHGGRKQKPSSEREQSQGAAPHGGPPFLRIRQLYSIRFLGRRAREAAPGLPITPRRSASGGPGRRPTGARCGRGIRSRR